MIFDLAIQIVNYNTKQYLNKCLKDLLNDLEESNIKYKVIVLDNNSNDDLSDLQKKFPNVAFYFSQQNLGFGGGHNYLSKKSESKYILILNPDIRFIENSTIKRLFQMITSENKVKVVGPKLLTEEKTSQLWDHGEIDKRFAKNKKRPVKSYWKNRNEITEVAWVSGAVLLVEKSVLEKIGGFDENFFLYKEEEDLCLRIRDLGFKILYAPNIKVEHIGSAVANKLKYIGKSKRYFIDKHSEDN